MAPAQTDLPQKRYVQHVQDLPACCRPTPLNLPIAAAPIYRVAGRSDTQAWGLGLDMWHLDVGISLELDFDNVLARTIADHVAPTDGHDDLPDDFVERALNDHGVRLDDYGTAWVGRQTLNVARFHSSDNAAAGREYISGPASLAYAADELASDLIRLVEPLVADDDEDLWVDEIIDRWPEVEYADAAILLRSVTISPIARGHNLGAWAAAQSIALFAHPNTLIATMAAPLTPQDVLPEMTDPHARMNPEQRARWGAMQKRLANHWATQLGLTPLTTHPDILVGSTAYLNEALTRTLGIYKD